jgi:hypothetical protein
LHRRTPPLVALAGLTLVFETNCSSAAMVPTVTLVARIDSTEVGLLRATVFFVAPSYTADTDS